MRNRVEGGKKWPMRVLGQLFTVSPQCYRRGKVNERVAEDLPRARSSPDPPPSLIIHFLVIIPIFVVLVIIVVNLDGFFWLPQVFGGLLPEAVVASLAGPTPSSHLSITSSHNSSRFLLHA